MFISIRQAAIVATLLLGAVLAFWFFFVIKKNSKNTLSIKKNIIYSKDFIGTEDKTRYPPVIIGTNEGHFTKATQSNISFSFLCKKCSKFHTISQSGDYIDYIILPCNGEKIMKSR